MQGGAGGITPHTLGSRAGRCTSGKRPGTQCKEAGWVRKILPPHPLGFEHWTVQHVASRHADRFRTDSLNTMLKGHFLVFHVLLDPVSHVLKR